MSILKKSMLIEPHDNVAVAVEPIEAGEATMVGGEEIVANQFIKEGHKIARTDIAKGDEIDQVRCAYRRCHAGHQKGRLGPREQRV